MEKVKNEQGYGLHHTPFTIMWMSIPAVAWSIILILALSLNGLRETWSFADKILYWLGQDGFWLEGLLVGIVLGLITAIAQVWLIRQRYGFVPRFWWVVTIMAWGVSGLVFFASMRSVYGYWGEDSEPYIIFMWLFTPIFIQVFALWSHLRKSALLWLIAGLGAGIISILVYHSGPRYNEVIYAFVYGTLAQTSFTAMTLIFLMARHRRHNISREVLVAE